MTSVNPEFESEPVSDVAVELARGFAFNYLGYIARGGMDRLNHEQMDNTGGYFNALKRHGIQPEDFVTLVKVREGTL